VSAAATLSGILTDEAALYEALLALLRDEEAALIRGSSEVTAASLAEKEALVLRIRLAEIARQAAVRRLTGRADTRLRDLPGAGEGELGAARRRLGTALERVAEATRRVDILLGRALTRLEDALRILHEATGLGPRYTHEGALVRAARPTLEGRA
jgi:hypothetical protein